MTTPKVRVVFNGYLKLTSQEQNELIAEINDYNQKIQKGLIKEGTGRLDGEISLGPLARGCPCCGRS
jgi:hypothetical protein